MREKQTAPGASEAGGAASAAAPATDDLFTRLSAAGRELVPVAYRFVPALPVGRATIMRLVESRPYRAAGYVCGPFHKPISKCCDADEPRDDE